MWIVEIGLVKLILQIGFRNINIPTQHLVHHLQAKTIHRFHHPHQNQAVPPSEDIQRTSVVSRVARK